jgi:hypothetical protein
LYRRATIVVALLASLCACFRHAARTPAPAAAAASGAPPPAISASPPAPAAAAPEPPARAPEPSPSVLPGPSAAGPPTESPRAPIPVAAGGAVRVEMKNVNLHVTDRVVLMIHSLRGALLRTARSRPPVFDDRESFVMRIDAGEIAMSTASLTALMNDYVFAYRKAPIKDLEITTDKGRLEQEGVLDKGIGIPFKVKAELLPTPDGRIRVHARSIKAAGLPVKGLMGLLGIEMDDMVKIQAGRGIVVEDNDFILDPQQMLPPPHIRGNVSSVRIEGDQVIQVFGTGAAQGRRLCPYASYRNYMYFRGGNLRFGKLTMVDTDLALIDQDAKDPFDFNLDRYNDQLVAGYSKNTPSRGLKTFMPDADDLRARTEPSFALAATFTAAANVAPEEIPQKMPSFWARARAASRDSTSPTSTASS